MENDRQAQLLVPAITPPEYSGRSASESLVNAAALQAYERKHTRWLSRLEFLSSYFSQQEARCRNVGESKALKMFCFVFYSPMLVAMTTIVLKA